MSLTGMALSVFLLAHVAGNLLILVNPLLFNDYAYALTKNKAFLYTAEAGLIAVFVLHIVMAIKLSRANREARPERYEVRANSGRSRRFWGSSNMGITGTLILIFLVFHIWHFKYGESYPTVQNGVEMRDLAKNVIDDFQRLEYVAIYVAALLLVGLHLLHGFRSAFETLGLATTRWDSAFKIASRVYVVGVIGGFLLIPIAIFLKGGAL